MLGVKIELVRDSEQVVSNILTNVKCRIGRACDIQAICVNASGRLPCGTL